MSGLVVADLVAKLGIDDREFNSGMANAHRTFGKAGDMLGTAFKRGAVVAGAAVTGLVGTALVKGFQRLSSIENATAKLTGLGHSAAEVQLIMDNALASVKGTAYGLDEAATIAATTVAAGIKPGQQLEATLRLVADAATIGGTSLGEMGAVFNKVAASNKIQGDVIAQLNDAGIPVVQFLGKELGKTSAQVVDLASAGKIHFPEFQKAMEKGLGGAALASGGTTIGSWKNMIAALSRLGASALSGIFPSIKVAFSKVGDYLDGLEQKYGGMFKKWGEKVSAGFQTGGFTGMFKAMLPAGVGEDLINTFNVIKGTTVAIVKVLGTIGKVFLSLPGTVQKFAIAAGILALALNKFGLLGSTKGLLGGLLGKAGGAAASTTLDAAISANTVATEANTLALGGKIPGGGGPPVANPLGPAGPAAGGGLLSKIKGPFSWTGLLGMAAMSAGGAGVMERTLTPKDIAQMKSELHLAGEKGGQAFATGINAGGANIARSLRASGDKAGAGLAAGLAHGVGPALQSIQRVRNSAGRPIHMGNLDATQMINEISRLSAAFGSVRSAARTAGDAAANAIRSPAGGGGSYRGHFMAAGGYVPARPGGTPVVLGEAGEGEYVTPASKMGGGTRGGDVHVHIAQVVGTDRRAAQGLADMVGNIIMNQVRFAG